MNDVSAEFIVDADLREQLSYFPDDGAGRDTMVRMLADTHGSGMKSANVCKVCPVNSAAALLPAKTCDWSPPRGMICAICIVCSLFAVCRTANRRLSSGTFAASKAIWPSL